MLTRGCVGDALVLLRGHEGSRVAALLVVLTGTALLASARLRL